MGKFLYAIIRGAEEKKYQAKGIEGRTVYSIGKEEISAVVSDVTVNKKIRPERRNIAAHQEVLKVLMKETTPLPMTFGVIGDTGDAIRLILAKNQTVLLSQLERVDNKVEMGLTVTLDVPNIFEYFVTTHIIMMICINKFY